MAQWAALRHARKLDSQNICRNRGCGRHIREGWAYCWRCALLGGERRIKPKESRP
jgi:hypothetical protein